MSDQDFREIKPEEEEVKEETKEEVDSRSVSDRSGRDEKRR